MPTPEDREQNNRFALPNQMNDDAIWDLLNVYADGEATPDEVAQAEALLRRQPSLSQELTFLRRTAESARTVVEVEPPAHLRSAIFAATIHRPTFARRVGMAWERLQTALVPQTARFALAGSACAAAGLAALLLLPHRQQEPQPVHRAVRPLGPIMAYVPPVAPEKSGSPDTPEPIAPPIDPAENVVKVRPSVHVLAQNGLHHGATHTDKRVAQLALNVDRMIVSHLLTPGAAPAAMRIKVPSGAKLQVVANIKPLKIQKIQKIQKPDSFERVASTEPSGQFSPLPKMDLAYQHGPTTAVVKNADDTLGANIDGSHDAASEQPAPAVTNAPDSGGRHIIRVSLSQLPPNARQYVTTADLKREIDARNLGFNHLALNRIERKQCDVPIFSKPF